MDADWLARKWLAILNTIHLRAAEEKQIGFPFQIKLLLNKESYSFFR